MIPTILFAQVPDWLSAWLTSLWLVAIGAVAGLLVLGLLWALLWLVRRSLAVEVPSVIAEGVMLPITWMVLGVALFGLVTSIAVDQPLEMLRSVPRLPFATSNQWQVELPPASAQVQTPVAVRFRGDELRKLTIESDQYVLVADAESEEQARGESLEVSPTRAYEYSKASRTATPFRGEFVENFYFTNLAEQPASIKVSVETNAIYPEASVIPITALGVILMYLTYFVQAWCFPRVSAIALATTKSELAQPLFAILAALGSFLLIVFQFVPYNTFGEDIKMLKDSGLTLVMILAIVQGVWAASNSVSEEIEGRTALTVLSKPIGRRRFIVGKLAGIIWTVLLLFIILGLVFLIVIAYKPIYDAREMGAETPAWDISHLEVTRTVPGLVLAFFETVVLVSISVAISTRLPLLANFLICFSIYVLGHLTPLIVQSQVRFAPVVFIGNLIATILPVLDHFNIQAAVAAGKAIPMSYLAAAGGYCLLYSTIALLLALALFEDRDLA